MNPEIVPKEYVTAGMIGYVFTNMKSAAEARYIIYILLLINSFSICPTVLYIVIN